MFRCLVYPGRPNSGTFIHPAFGMNFRVTDMQSAVGCSQLEKLEYVINCKKSLYNMYCERLSQNEKLKLMQPNKYSTYIPFRFAFTSCMKSKIEKALNESKVQTRDFFYPMHLQPSVQEKYPVLKDVKLEVSEKLNKEGLALPMHLAITESDIDLICSIINESTK